MLFLTLIALFILVSLIVTWVNQSQIQQLRKDLEQIRKLVGVSKEEQQQEPATIKEIVIVKEHLEKPDSARDAQAISMRQEKEIEFEKSKDTGLESQLAMRLPIWIGGIALAFAGFFLVKYSIEAGLLSPLVRVMLGGILGLGLVLSGQQIYQKASTRTTLQIGQSLTGAGLAVLYGSLYAATSLYHILPNFLGFVGMIFTTGLAILLSLRQGQPIAFLGLLGGFLTPTMVSAESPSVINLFSYLYILFAALIFLARFKNWGWLWPLAALGAYAWVVLWLFAYFIPTDGVWLTLFIIAVLATSVFGLQENAPKADKVSKATGWSPLSLASTGLGLILLSSVVYKTDFAMEQWVLYGILAIGSFVLAYFKERQFSAFPVLTLIISTVLLGAWEPSYVGDYLRVLIPYAILYLAGSNLLFKHEALKLWAGMIFASSLIFYGLLYSKLVYRYNADIHYTLWASLAVTFAVLAVYWVTIVKQRIEESEILQAIFAAMVTTFIAITLAVTFTTAVFKTTLTFEMFGLILITQYIRLPILRYYAAILGGLFVVLSLENIFTTFASTLFYVMDSQIQYSTAFLYKDPLIYLLLPAVMFFLSSYLGTKDQQDRISKWFELTGYVLLSLGTFSFIQILYVREFAAMSTFPSLLENGLITNAAFIIGLGALSVNYFYKRQVSYQVGIFLIFFGLARIVLINLLGQNPFQQSIYIHGWPFLNTLWLPFGLPILWSWVASRLSLRFAKLFLGASLFLLFMFITMNIRSIFHLPYLSEGVVTDFEIYSYSVAWLLLALTLLFFGILRKDVLLRYASLGLILLTVGKAFLFDASQLVGLYRVISFLGLGLSLIGISYVYSRYVK